VNAINAWSHPRELLQSYRVLFWDFDGVIKESLKVKADAFENLFEAFGRDVASRVRRHHERNSGVSRYEKLSLYLQWAQQPCSSEDVERYAQMFSLAVRQAVIDSPWVPGVREYLESNFRVQLFVLVSATPGPEMESIVSALGIRPWFQRIYGAPIDKADAISAAIAELGCTPGDALFIGDSAADLDAAMKTDVAFLLRCTDINGDLRRQHTGASCLNFEAW
jgi:phosphoglycolate phosphatase-like HAD superfamily hydrolase